MKKEILQKKINDGGGTRKLIKLVGTRKWQAICGCGKIGFVYESNILSSKALSCQSCGNERHGYRYERIYGIWYAMNNRCYNENFEGYSHYGGRGISVCTEWRESFMIFKKWAMSSGYKKYLTIDRTNNDKEYSPDNCRWVTMAVQLRNRRNSSKHPCVFPVGKMFRVVIRRGDTVHRLGYFDELEKAEKVRDKFFKKEEIDA